MFGKRGALVLPVVWLTFAVGGSCASWADLKWDQTLHRVRLRPGQAEARFEYGFVNGGTPLRIRGIHTSCGCAVARTSATELTPGERGRIEAEFRVDSRRGRQRKYIRLETDDPRRPIEELVLDVEVPEPAWVSPRLVWWEGHGAGTRAVDVRATPGATIRAVRARAAHAGWDVRAATLSRGRHYRVDIAPGTSPGRDSTVVAVTVDIADGPSISYPIHALVFDGGDR